MIDHIPPDLYFIDQVTELLAPGQSAPMGVSACAFCVQSGTAHRVKETFSTAETEEDGVFFDETGAQHVHSWRQVVRTLECSNGHIRGIRYLIACPACGWTVDTQT